MGAASGEIGTFPEIEFAVGPVQDGVLPIILSLPKFRQILNENSDTALRKGTAVPEAAKEMLSRALAGCNGCHLNGDENRRVGRNHGATCSGFTLFEGDLHEALEEVAGGYAVSAEIKIEELPGAKGAFPVLTTPCGILPSDLYIAHGVS